MEPTLSMAPSASPTLSVAPSYAPTSNKDIRFSSRSGWYTPDAVEDEDKNNLFMMFWIIIGCAVGAAVCIFGVLCCNARRRKEAEGEYYDEDAEQYYDGGRRRTTDGRQRKQSHRSRFYEGGDDHVAPPDFLFVERGHDDRRVMRDRQGEIDLMNKLYGGQRPDEWL